MNESVIKDVQYIVWVIFENFLKIAWAFRQLQFENNSNIMSSAFLNC